MSGWKLQCYFCSDTVSTIKLSKEYYLMHLVAVHNMQQHGDRLLEWVLAQQGLGQVPGSVAIENSEMGNINHRVMNGGTQARKTAVPAPLLKMKGITVTRGPGDTSLAQRQAQGRAVSQWANGCEHGCRICKKFGKTWSSFTRQGLVSHLQTEHVVSEQEYKKEFQCQSLVTRASTTQCMECSTRVRRHPASWTSHLVKHGLNMTSYWLKHVKPKRSQRAGSSPTCWKPMARPPCVSLIRRAVSDNGGGSGAGGTVTTPVGGDSVAVEDSGVNPMDMLELQMGDSFHMEKDDFDNIGVKDGELVQGQTDTADKDINANTVQITPLREDDMPMVNNSTVSDCHFTQ